MSQRPTVLEALRRFLPDFLKTGAPLGTSPRRAIRAITHCRTAALGGSVFACPRCQHRHLAYHSCNHKACPQCGALANRRWVQRELNKRIHCRPTGAWISQKPRTFLKKIFTEKISGQVQNVCS